MHDRNDKALGALLGLAVGDALGTTLEFSRPEAARATGFPAKMTGPLRDIVGGGPFNVEVGQTTDDTQMATALAASLVACKGYNPTDVAQRYKRWRNYAFDVGGQTSGGISRIASVPVGEEYRAGYVSWSSGRIAAGNGSLMRTAPIGVYFADDPAEVVRVSVLDSMMTHGDPRCLLACAAYNRSIAFAVRVGTSNPKDLLREAGGGVRAALDFIRATFPDYYTEQELEEAQEALYSGLDFAYADDPRLLGHGAPCIHGTAGFVLTAFNYAYWSLMHATAYDEAIIDVVNRGGDADTNGAIVGGLLGAYFGEKGIPQLWRDKVLTALSDRPSSPWWRLFHPRFFLAVVGLSEELPDLNRVEETVQSWQRPVSVSEMFKETIEDPANHVETEDGSYATGRSAEAIDFDSPFIFENDLPTPADDDDGPLFPEFVRK